MQIAMIGLGRMGANLVRRLLADGHDCVVYDRNPETVAELAAEGAVGIETLADLATALTPPRTVWIMVPAGVTGAVIDDVAPHLSQDDTIIDGGNTHYQNDITRAATLAERGIHLVDVGTSGGVHGLERGYCLMIGGETEVVDRLDPIFATIAPGVDAAPRSPGRSGPPAQAEHGYFHCGPVGAGHFVKMVHNGIEYGMMAAYAEGFNLLAHANVGDTARATDAETTPLAHPEHYQYDMNLAEIAELWRRGSVIPSWLLDLTAEALHESPQLEEFSGYVSDSGEGRWTVQAAVDTGTPASVLTAALYQRFDSRDRSNTANRVLSAMRAQFGGHQEKK